MSGFYKNDDGIVLHGPNFVLNAEYELRVETKDDHEYPVDGWYWFDTEDEAYGFFGLEKPEPPVEPTFEPPKPPSREIIGDYGN